jgi:3-oxoacyl-[acyl-carrier protein] reductase
MALSAAGRDTFGERFGLDQRHAVVAGAGQGIGRASALALARAGARVVCADIDASLAHETETIILESGGGAVSFSGDMTDRRVVKQLLSFSLDAFGEVDAVVDVIGAAIWSGIIGSTEEDWDRNISLNVLHNLHVLRVFGARMVEQKTAGSFVHIASINGLLGQPGNFACAAAKAALMSLIRTAGLEFARYGIRVNGVAPGSIDTERLRSQLSPRFLDALAASVPLGRLASVDEIANAVLFLASGLSSYITAQTLIVDGGAIAKFPFPHPSDLEA